MILYAEGSGQHDLSANDLRKGLSLAMGKLPAPGKILIIPPDITRFHSRAGEITCMAVDHFGDRVKDILPALGTHRAMTAAEINHMFPGIPHHLFRVHDWRNDIVRIGEVPSEYISEISEGEVNYSIPIELNRLILDGGHDLILSVGQVVPHEVIGMANYNKNILIGCGGPENINKSHFLGAVYGMERLLGVAQNPVRQALNYASDHFLTHLPVVYVLTVLEQVPASGMITRGLFIGTGEEVFLAAAELSARVNNTIIPNPLRKVVVNLDPHEYRSTWLGNKSIYRTRMAIADGGELIVLAPGVEEFGEDPEIDRLIRKYGYHGTPATLAAVAGNEDLRNNLSAAAHLIHGSSEGRFRITYCPGNLSPSVIEKAGYQFGNVTEMTQRYKTSDRGTGTYKTEDGEEYFYISNPATGLWKTS